MKTFNSLRKRLTHRYFSVNFEKFLGKLFCRIGGWFAQAETELPQSKILSEDAVPFLTLFFRCFSHIFATLIFIYKQLGSGLSFQSYLYFQGFLGSRKNMKKYVYYIFTENICSACSSVPLVVFCKNILVLQKNDSDFLTLKVA